MKTLKSILFSLMAITMVTVFLSSCEKGEETVTESQKQFNDAENQRIMDALCVSYDNCEEDAEITENGITIQKCMHLDKADYLEFLSNPSQPEAPSFMKVPHPENPGEMVEIEVNNSEIEDRQRIFGATGFAEQNEVIDVRYYIRASASNSDCNGGYDAALVADAASNINSVSGCKLNFLLTNSESDADIVIACDEEWNYWISVEEVGFSTLPVFTDVATGEVSFFVAAKADTPSGNDREIGQYISVNDHGNGNYDDKVATMTHEFLHTVGVAHTTENGPLGGTNQYHVSGTAITDNNSLMNAVPTVNTLSNNDKKLLRYLWPDYLRTPVIIDHHFDFSGDLVIKFKNYSEWSRPYHRMRFTYWTGSNYVNHTISGTGARLHKQTYQLTIPSWNLPSSGGNRWIYIRGESYRGEVNSSPSSWYSVNFPGGIVE